MNHHAKQVVGTLVLGTLAPLGLAIAQSVHPYPLFPFAPVPGRAGFGTPEIQPVYEAWRAALGAGDEEKAAEIIKPFGSEHFLHGYPQFLPYPGSIEHVRADWQRYVPPYPLFNHQTLVKNVVLHDYVPTRAACATFIEPLYWYSQWNNRIVTSATRELSAYPWKPGESIDIAVGTLTPKRMHAVRVIAALKPEDVVRFSTVANPKPVDPKGAEKQLVFSFEINDRPDGGVSTYFLRGRTWDQFYETVVCHWDVVDDRDYRIRITLLEESEATLYAYNIDVHNIFGANAQRAGKQRATTVDAEARQARWANRRQELEEMAASEDRDHRETVNKLHGYHGGLHRDYPAGRNRTLDQLLAAIDAPPLSGDERRRRDESLWRSLPPLNHTIDRWPRDTDAELNAMLRAGWAPTGDKYRVGEWDEPWQLVRRDENGAIVETYTSDDMAAYKPLPGTGDRGYGVRLEAAKAGRHVLSYMAGMHMERNRYMGRELSNLMGLYNTVGDEHVARDAAFLLARYVYSYPPLHGTKYLTFVENRPPYLRGDDGRGGRYSPAHWGSLDLNTFMAYYDQLFDYIKDNQELAEALGRHIPWVKTPADVRHLFEVYGVQYNANEYLHSQMVTATGQAPSIARMALIQNDTAISRPWMEFLFKLAWQYPQTIAGVDDTVVTSVTRDGVHDIGSWSYAGTLGLNMAEMTGDYVASGGDPRFDLGDYRRYAKSLAGAYWDLESRVAGGFYPGIGDVGGPARPRDYQWGTGFARRSWQLTGDPRFAWYVANDVGRGTETDAEWQTILDAAATVTLDPRLTQKSRVLSDWFAVLEGGVGHPDYRFHRAVAVNVGDSGWGHSHDDTLDLRLWALGQNMSGDLGQRPEYGRPRHNTTFSHNLVEVDGDGREWRANSGMWDGYAWVRNLFDAPGAQVLLAEATPPFNHPTVTLHRRHVALVDVHEGQPSARAENPHADPEVLLPASYVLDVVRVSGGKQHTYCFTGSVDDNHVEDGGFEANVGNRRIVTPGEDTPEGKYLQNFRWSTFAADKLGMAVKDLDKEWAADPADDTLVATWRRGERAGGLGPGGRKHMRLHLLNVGDHRVLHAINTDVNGNNPLNPDLKHYSGRMLYVQKTSAEPLDSVYVALLEPYAGEPHIVGRELLAVADNEADAWRATAVAVTTANGHTDLLFSDGRPETARSVASPFGTVPVRVQGEFAYVSHDAAGLRQATLNGGTHLVAPGIELRLAMPAYTGTVRAVDYLERVAVIDGLPAEPELAGLFFEIGNDGHRTSFEVEQVGRDAAGATTIRLRKGIEIMLGTVIAADYEAGTVTTNVAMRHLRGRDDGLTATTGDFNQRWRARFDGGNRFDGFTFTLTGRPISAADFPLGGKLSIWEFGDGDEVVLKTGVSLRRLEDGLWQVYANAPFTVDLDGRSLEWAADGQRWQPVGAGSELGPGRGQPRAFMLRIAP